MLYRQYSSLTRFTYNVATTWYMHTVQLIMILMWQQSLFKGCAIYILERQAADIKYMATRSGFKTFTPIHFYLSIYSFTAQVLKVCRTPGPTACSQTKMLLCNGLPIFHSFATSHTTRNYFLMLLVMHFSSNMTGHVNTIIPLTRIVAS